ncbi:hypothetical protein [Pelomonas sp. Root1237]|uniref:hypothetical protein n=1 Tax=Pelomonas sp. Root1237 TaxID=1736434 RepID=UPI0006F7F967|nr:hypothetical protein [Pelomonas sp. Root1237]KQV87429.1 hypothetical protein ASC91_17560 [Pelomonas sp. Root1237]
MTVVQPATISDEVQDDLLRATYAATHWLSPEDQFVIELQDRLKQLDKVDAATASVVRGGLFCLLGDTEQMHYWFDNGERLHAEPWYVNGSRVFSLANLGYFSDAAALYAKIADVDNPRLKRLWSAGLSTASFKQMAGVFQRAADLKLELDPNAHRVAVEAAIVLERLGLDQSRVLAALDTFGQVQRESRLLWLNRHLSVTTSLDAEEPGLLIELPIATDADQAVELTDQAVEKCIDAGLLMPGLSVAFVASEPPCQ